MSKTIVGLWLIAVILLNCFPQDAEASSLGDEGVGLSTDTTRLIERSPPAKTKLPANKEGLENLFEEGNGADEKNQISLVIKLSDRRVYVYQDNELQTSYPVAVGRDGWETPTGNYQVIQAIENPSWQHPFTGEIIPPGPTNPLGARWIGFWTDGTNYIGFHGAPEEQTVGTADFPRLR